MMDYAYEALECSFLFTDNRARKTILGYIYGSSLYASENRIYTYNMR